MDFFIRGYYKEIVYARDSSTVEEVGQKLEECKRKINENRTAFRRLKDNFIRRCRLCIEVKGGHFENLL
nr:unnamed protein product [Callosobruchus chinensis]